MNAAHLHLLVNHLPIVGSLMGFLLLLFATLLKKQELSKTVLGLFVIIGATSGVAYLTGEPAEEFLENRPGIEEKYIEEHEEMAELALISSLATGVLSMGVLVLFRKRGFQNKLLWVVLFSGLVTFFLMAKTGYLGGTISHPETRNEEVTP